MLDRMRGIAGPNPSPWLRACLVAVAVAFLYPLCHRAIILSDEGYLLQQSLDLLAGKVIYRDMDSFITPGAWFLIAGAFAIFGASVFVSRMVMLVAGAALVWITHRLVSSVASPAWGLFAVASMLLCSVWAFPAWTFAFYSPLAILAALFGLDRLLAWHRDGRRRHLFWCGAWLGLAVCLKQNYGAFGILGALLGYVALSTSGGGRGREGEGEREEREGGRNLPGDTFRDVGAAALGVLTAGTPFLAYLAAHGALGHAWASLVVHPFEFMGRHDIPFAPLSFLWKPDLLETSVEKLTYLSYAMLQSRPIGFLQPFRGLARLHVLLYWVPIGVFLLGALLALFPGRASGGGADANTAPRSLRAWARRIDAPLLAILLTCAFLFSGVLPRADFNHLVNVYQPVVVAAAVVLQRLFRRLEGRSPVARKAVALGVGLFVLTYGSIALYWYASVIHHLRFPLDQPRGGVLVNRTEAERIDQQVRTIEQRTAPGDYVLTVPDLVMLNFLAERGVPSAYYNLYEHHIAADEGAGVVAGAEEHGVELALVRYDNFFSDRTGLLDYAPVLARYIVRNFERSFVGRAEDYIVYQRREAPLDEHPFVSALQDCDLEGEEAHVEHHLLFSSLYHHPADGKAAMSPEVSTRCRVRVPDSGGELSFELGYRRPFFVKPGSKVRHAVSVVDDASATVVAEEEHWLTQERRKSEIQMGFRRFDVDLAPWAGRDVELIFSTFMSGAALNHPLDLKGFALVWRDPRVQQRAGGARP